MKKIVVILVIIALLVSAFIVFSILWEKKNNSLNEMHDLEYFPTNFKGIDKIQNSDKEKNNFPKIASWLSKKDEIISSKKPYDLVMSGWFTIEEAKEIKKNSPQAILLAGLTYNWIWDNDDWKTFLLNVASYNKEEKEIIEEMFLHKQNGERCAFGWESEDWNHEEIYAMDPRNEQWIELIVDFYKNVLEQPQHDGIIVDMVTEKSWCKDTISDEYWIIATKNIMGKVKELNVNNKLIIFNSGRNLSEIDEYSDYFDGYVMENFIGNQINSTYLEGLKEADSGYIIIYAMDTDDSGTQDMNKMRLGLTLSLLNDNTYFTYDFGPRDHGQAWWYEEYNVDLGQPLGEYFQKGNAYMREFENGIVISSPENNVSGQFSFEYTDVTTGEKSASYSVEQGDGRIFLK